MTFEKFVCWKLDMIRQVMNVEATQTATTSSSCPEDKQ
jgi:hypothetical protein